ncbi:serine/threonine-protein kinase [Streptomyces stramineus]|uniref:Serine/threonine-protein kinase n=1 Tax=Streptomyces stramineus TaxID=173861 RepID=A0ABP3JI43_9ACTN
MLAEDPQVIGAYRLLGRLGAGGMGRVYLGRSAGGRTVAVKVVHPQYALDEQFRARFRREVAAARRVGGDLGAEPHGTWTAPVLDADPDAPVPWVATGYVAGPSLTQAVEDTGAQPERTVRALTAGLAEALAAVHALGLVHRDVKPSNVLLTLDGPRLIDFGIARATDATASLTATGVSVGSPGYMAPEQILGREVTGAADVFSLGAVLAYAATGEPPFPGDHAAVLLYRVVHEPPALGPRLTGELRALAESCLAKDPGDRPAPGEVVRRLAPGGAATLVRSGWLPGPLVESVSRRAVELLNLEAAGFDAPGASAASGSSGSSGPSIREATAPDGPADAPPVPSASPAPPTGKKIEVTAGAGGGQRRPRRLSCTLVVSLAAALAVATSLLFVFDLLPGRENGGGPASDARRPPAASAPASDKDPSATVPKAFLGTWNGEIRQADGTPNGTLTAVITAGGKGAYVARTTYKALNILECRSKARLLTASARRITLEEVTDGTAGLGCTGETARITFTLADGGKLAYASQDAKGGKPTATLARTGG